MPNYGYVWQPADTVHDARLAALHERPLGLHGLRLDLGLQRAVRLDHLSLRALDAHAPAPLGVGAGRAMGAGLGRLALRQRLRGLGAAAAGGAIRRARQACSNGRMRNTSSGPSDYTFVPASEFGDDRMADVALPPEQNEAVYDGSANVTGHRLREPTVVFCYGPNYDFIRQKSRRLPPRLKVDRVGFGGRNGAFVSNGTLADHLAGHPERREPLRARRGAGAFFG